MKNARALLLLFSLAFPLQAQTLQPPGSDGRRANALAEIVKLNKRVIELYNGKKLGEAVETAKKALDIAAKEGLSGDANVLTVKTNLAEVYLLKDKKNEAIELFSEALGEYEKLRGANSPAVESVVGRLAVAYARKPDLKNAEIYHRRLLALREKLYGAESKKTVEALTALAFAFQNAQKYADAEPLYLRAIAVNDKIMTEAEREKREDLTAYQCFSYHKAFARGKLIEGVESFDEFLKTRGEGRDRDADPGIVNGKAITLIRPAYPEEARRARVGGFAIVKVTIDERGDVLDAKAYCGFLEFVAATEAAARRSKFAPTLHNGSPVKVTGDIIYNFARQ